MATEGEGRRKKKVDARSIHILWSNHRQPLSTVCSVLSFCSTLSLSHFLLLPSSLLTGLCPVDPLAERSRKICERLLINEVCTTVYRGTRVFRVRKRVDKFLSIPVGAETVFPARLHVLQFRAIRRGTEVRVCDTTASYSFDVFSCLFCIYIYVSMLLIP